MGKTVKPKYAVRFYDQDRATVMAWNCRTHGRVTDANAEKFRVKMNDSLQPGGCNEHIRLTNGGIPHVRKVEIYLNDGSFTVIADAKMPTFEAI